LRKGFKDCVKDFENQNEKSKLLIKDSDFKLKEKSIDIKKLE